MSKKLTEIEEKAIIDAFECFGLAVSKIMKVYEDDGRNPIVELTIPVDGENDIQVTCQRLPSAIDKGLH